jgi:hypothetical protein
MMAFDNAQKFVAVGMPFVQAKVVADAIDSEIAVDAVLLTTNQTVAGVKTFSSSPVIPTAALATNTTAAASTAFVLANAGKTKTEIAALAALTDSTTGTAGATLAATVGIETIAIPLTRASMTTAAADLMTAYVPGYAFELLSLEFVTTTIGAGASASQVINLEIGTTNVTGGVLTLLLADTDTLGKKTAATAITAANVGTAADTLSIEVAASGTVFTAGDGFLLLKLRNMDTVNAIASLAAKVNLITAALKA